MIGDPVMTDTVKVLRLAFSDREGNLNEVEYIPNQYGFIADDLSITMPEGTRHLLWLDFESDVHQWSGIISYQIQYDQHGGANNRVRNIRTQMRIGRCPLLNVWRRWMADADISTLTTTSHAVNP